MAWSRADIPDLTGKVAVVSGANGGIGLEVARELAGKAARVVMASRDRAKTEEARASILAENPNASLEPVPLDLGSLASVREAAATMLAAHPRIDILVDNAGVMGVSERRTENGSRCSSA
jgi:NAD(P)-dependent dehydrogenase (short-subunit alcohol dehydrogenase family)